MVQKSVQKSKKMGGLEEATRKRPLLPKTEGKTPIRPFTLQIVWAYSEKICVTKAYIVKQERIINTPPCS